jgi:flagellar motility protein MotE (MotC chaperone)
MAVVMQQLKVAKCTKQELNDVRDFLQKIDSVLEENKHYEEDEEINKEIADVARTLPYRSFVVPLNLGILLDNYQDEESEILEHPKWIMELYEKIETLEKEVQELKQKSE